MMSITLTCTCISNIDLAKAKAKLPLPSLDSCQLTSTWMCSIRLHVPQKLESVTFHIDFPVVWTYRQAEVHMYVHVTTNNFL